MARWKEFIISLEMHCDEFMSLSDLQAEYDDAMRNEDYKHAGKIKKMIEERAKGEDEEEEFKILDEACYIDLDEVSAFYQGEFEDGTKYTRVCIKGGESIPVTMPIEEFKQIFFNK